MSSKLEKKQKVIIAGSGPAGLTAAIYAARANLAPVVIEGMAAGGQLMTTSEIENFPGFPEGIDGGELMGNMRKQAERFGTKFVPGDITEADLTKRPFTIKADDQEFEANALIIATGAEARYLDIESVNRLKGKGISACATCDGFFYKDKIVYVIGGGDSALEEAIFLTHYAKAVYIVHRRDEFRGSKIMQEYAKKNEKVHFVLSHVLEEVLSEAGQFGGEKVSGIKLKDLKTDSFVEYPADGIFFAIGHTPNTEIFKDAIKTDEKQFIMKDPQSTRTNIAGVFVAGDVGDPKYQQAITAAGTGAMAAIDVETFLVEVDEL